MTASCIGAERLDELACGGRPTDRERRHLAQCRNCQARLGAYREDEEFLRTKVRPALAAAAAPADAPLFFGPYGPCVLIGRGGMASVYSACGPDGERVAVKVCRDARALPYFRREIATMRRAHAAGVPGIPPVLAADEEHVPAYFVTRLYTGGSLADALAARGPLSTEAVLTLAERLAGVLADLRRLDVVHRDIKPSNVLFDDAGQAWLADLGLARQYGENAHPEDRLSSLGVALTRPDSPPVTVAYMSPEQAAGARLTPASDVFALGIVLHEAATGTHPFPGRTVYEVAAAIQRDAPPPIRAVAPDLPELFAEALTRCLSRDPARRPSPKKIVECCKESLRGGNPVVKTGRAPVTATEPATEGATTMTRELQTIEAAAQCLSRNGLTVSPALNEALSQSRQPRYRIVVVGKYQVGKSTLINRAFLKSEVLLKEGMGLPTTGVVTEVVHGERPCLEVFRWQREAAAAADGRSHGDVRTGAIEAAEVIADPSAEDLSRFTAATGEARRELTEQVAGVRLSWPCETLRRFTLVDTPGVDDPDGALLANTTYRVIPEADAAILVVGPRRLDLPELEFLHSRVFQAGLNQLMVLVSYNPDGVGLSQQHRDEVLSIIRSQLASAGREHIPVRMFCYDRDVKGDILNTPEAIERAIVDFAEASAARGRLGRTAHHCAADLRRAETELVTRIAAADASYAERADLLAKARQRKIEIEERYRDICAEFVAFLRGAQTAYRDRLFAGLDTIARDYRKGFHETTSLSDVQTRLGQADCLLRPAIEDLFHREGRAFDDAVRGASRGLRTSIASAGLLLNLPGRVEIAGGPLAQVPEVAVQALDYLAAVLILPGGLIAGVVIRFLLGRLPLIGRYMPDRLFTKALVAKIDRSVEVCFADLRSSVADQLDTLYREVDAKLTAGFASYVEAELDPAIRVLAEADSSVADKARVEAVLADVRKHLAAMEDLIAQP
ncbi:MAG: protein kinase [Lentisphaerae bacterium]|nr:protein kinase [Lentisphaerota bacterium]